MDLKISYEDLLEMIKQLPSSQLDRLRSDLSRLIKKAEKKEGPTNEMQEFLLAGPTMSAEQSKQFQELRKQFKEWRKN